MFGSLIYPSGEGVYTIHERKRHQEVQAHIEHLVELDPKAFYFIVMDSASVHTTPRLNDFWEKHKGTMEPVFQPTYSPHVNLIERLWRFMRGQMTKNQFYDSLETLSKAVVEWLEKLSFAEFSFLMGIDEEKMKFV